MTRYGWALKYNELSHTATVRRQPGIRGIILLSSFFMPTGKYICFALLLIATNCSAQLAVKDSASYKIVVAGPEYQKGHRGQWLWGRNCRVEWTTPVRVSVLKLDTAYGGLTPYKTSGGNETKSLRLRNPEGKEYVIRSIRKSREDVVPPEYKNTFIEDIVKDGVSMSHPYGAFALPVMEQQAGIYHARPVLVYVPSQQRLDTFNAKFGNDLYLFEQKVDGDWSNARNLGGFKKFVSTEEVLEKLHEDNRTTADQYLFIKTRLFDMLISDWDRHDGNWGWGEMNISGITWFVPVPHDRDQAFYSHNGKLVDLLLPAAGLGYMQNFDHQVQHINVLNYEMKDLDRFFANAMTLSDWEYAAKSLQKALTDSVIEASVKQLPPEIYKVSGKALIEKLKSRRGQLLSFATKYYLFIANEVEITGTKQREYFDVSTNPKGETVVAVYRFNNYGQKDTTPYYQRVFKPRETKEIRLFGIDGRDVFSVKNYSNDITVRLIGGPDKDTITQAGRTIHIYDDGNNDFRTASAQMHLSGDTAIHGWTYKWFRYNKQGFSPSLYYDTPDRLYVGINYRARKYAWRHDPYKFEHVIALNYSIFQNAPSITWNALYPKLIAGWDLNMEAGYDMIRWVNFYGTGNESQFLTKDMNYYRLRSEEWFANAGLQKQFGKSTFGFTLNYQRVKNKDDSDRFVSKVVFPEKQDVYETNQYGSVQLRYGYVSVNDSIVPTKGITFLAQAALWRNFSQLQWFQRYDAKVQAYIPITRRMSLFTRVGGMTVAGDDVFSTNTAQMYMHAIIGGARTLRGLRRERLWGQTAVYNSNELRYIWDLRSRLVNGKIGLVGFFDQGRVWMPGEKSNTIHMGYGPGVLLAPFNKMCVTVTYGMSEEISLIQIRLERLL